MKKISSYILLSAMLVLQLSGCGRDENKEGTQGADGPTSQEVSWDSGGELDPSAVLALSRKDNSLDVFSAAVNTPLRVEEPEDALEGGLERTFLGASRAYHFKKHLFQDRDACWDELSFLTAEGETGAESFEWENQLWGVGPVAGTDHYVTFSQEIQENGEGFRYCLTERDENHDMLRVFPLDFLSGSGSEVLTSLSDFAVDLSGVVHLVRQTEEGWQYLLVSQAGEILAEYIPEDSSIRGLIPLYDGRIAFWSAENGEDKGVSLQHMDAETGRPVLLAALEMNVYCCTLLDEDTLLYADKEGVYRSGLSGNDPELLYRWSNHGIFAYGVSAMQADADGRIVLIYKDSKYYNYLCLEPTTEETQICEITMAVSWFNMESYKWAVVEFNKRYPGCHIELIEYSYNDTALLTKLTAGKGPVLVDAFLVNFEELEGLWEPLDTVMEQLGVMEELYPSVMEMGKINENLYGVVTHFSGSSARLRI